MSRVKEGEYGKSPFNNSSRGIFIRTGLELGGAALVGLAVWELRRKLGIGVTGQPLDVRIGSDNLINGDIAVVARVKNPDPAPAVALDAATIRSMQFGQADVHFQFSSHIEKNPYKSIPDWFYTNILPNINLVCQGDTCANNLRRLVVSSSKQGFEIDRTYAPDLVRISDSIPNTALGNPDVQIRRDAIPLLSDFINEMETNGYTVHIRSAYRNRDEQKRLNDRDPSSAEKPGYSQHQGGLAADLGFTLQPGHKAMSDGELRAIAHAHGIVHPYDWDPPHYFMLDAVQPGLTQVLLNNGINVDNIDNINGVQLGIAQTYEYQILLQQSP